ncbi:MAG: methenyltetrahydromethanopterin cyclohydrolase [Candidatus Bathyarchaeota archaeon]|nr:MAG: methenyltetrahydromethanopterin cyclohydrolase [Candidatus Bathyarchaeota archaeon]
MNQEAFKLVKRLCESPDEYSISVRKNRKGVTLIDAGIQAEGGFNAGRIVTEICMGGFGVARIFPKQYDDVELSCIFVHSDHPAIATFGSQFAGWQIKKGNFFAIGSGPARALALKPRDIYEKIKYEDKADIAIMVLETNKEPPEELTNDFALECNVSPSQLYIILTPTTSITGSTQISGRIVETGLHKLSKLGIDPLSIRYAWGYAPIAPVHPKFAEAMGETNDVILYGGVAFYALEHKNDNKLKDLLRKAPSSASNHYGRPFKDIFKEANYDFYQIDPNLFAPAMFIINNIVTGSVLQVGKVNVEVLKQSLGLVTLDNSQD